MSVADTRTTAEAALAALPFEDFEEVVKADGLGETSDAVHDALRHPLNLERWRDALSRISQGIQAQLTQRAANLDALEQECRAKGIAGKGEFFAARAEHAAWRAKATYAKAKTDQQLIEAKRLLKAHNVASWTSARDDKVRRYKSALKQIANYDGDANPLGFEDDAAVIEFFQQTALDALTGEGE